ncbi:glycerol-3-phosphate dehydrogenase (NAD(P)+) [Lebetimonas natsushimae]|uniref:Glycerol-3-phosphate dehydrogenase [NAD(P)+] n=1 Tax=Lebetimonas natsushimae TaxID=1936991 RepID=A0A292YDS2_9BACT|nr:NAD(P)H-dependent glycerol-3-phosphate dehydrogenase [Lebetimonas natsushimae]GAX87519.1 glycerol-3-phosphate dehydrogenase (NAD(P)+) [Lebetimonas natsushimae]
MISIIGAGSWGSALYHAIKQKVEGEIVITSRRRRNIEGFVDIEKALESEYIVIAIAAQAIKNFLKKYNLKDKKVLVASKGIDKDELKFLNEIFEEYVSINDLAFLSGPSFAKEVKENKPTALVIASKNMELAKKFKTFFPKFIKIYIDDDVEGIEVAGAYKNVIAIAAGICEGLNLGANAKAALISRGLVEIDRFGEFFGAKKDTFLDVAGAGDLFLTANSTMSRNYRVGINLAKGKVLDDILNELGEVAEGVYTTEAIYKLSQKNNIYTPIATEVYKILYTGKKPVESLRDLLI